MGNLLWLALLFAVMSLVAWVAYRAGADTAQREAEYTIANLRRSNRVLRAELDVQALHKGRRP